MYFLQNVIFLCLKLTEVALEQTLFLLGGTMSVAHSLVGYSRNLSDL